MVVLATGGRISGGLDNSAWRATSSVEEEVWISARDVLLVVEEVVEVVIIWDVLVVLWEVLLVVENAAAVSAAAAVFPLLLSLLLLSLLLSLLLLLLLSLLSLLLLPLFSAFAFAAFEPGLGTAVHLLPSTVVTKAPLARLPLDILTRFSYFLLLRNRPSKSNKYPDLLLRYQSLEKRRGDRRGGNDMVRTS